MSTLAGDADHNIDKAVDKLIDSIDNLLPRICKKVEDAKKRGDTPTRGFDRKQIKKTQQAFQAMSEDSLLSASGEDIRMPTEPQPQPQRAPVKRASGTGPIFRR